MDSEEEMAEDVPEIWRYETPEFRRQYEPIKPEPPIRDSIAFVSLLLGSWLMLNSAMGFMDVCMYAYPGMTKKNMEYHVERVIPNFMKPFARPGIELGYTVCLGK